jgi:zinc protease
MTNNKRKNKALIILMLLLSVALPPQAWAQGGTGRETQKKTTEPSKNKSTQKKTAAPAPSERQTSTAPKSDGKATTPSAAVVQPNNAPLITFRILFQTGSASDPPGKEGVAALTAAMLAEGGTRQQPYERIVETVYPMGVNSPLGWQIDKEMTVFTVTTHADNLEKHYALIREMLLDPGFRQEDFTRLKTDALTYLRLNLRNGNDEELGKEALYNLIYAGHPYGHHNLGSVSALSGLTLDDVRAFYQQHYTRANLVLGLAGGYPPSFPQRVTADFAKLPEGRPEKIKLDAPKLDAGMRVSIIERETRSTAISLGFPIPVRRGDKDWAALAVVASYFGQHRSSNSYLYQRLREIRGLNYGDYAYIEYFPRGMFQFEPDPNLARQQQIFQIWIRPVEPKNGMFALRAALYEYDKLVKDGMTRETFETTREFLSKYANILTQTQSARLGYALDSRYYGIPDFGDYMRAELSKLTLEDVNRAIKQYLTTDRMRVVVITKDGEALRKMITGNTPSPVAYVSPVAKDITEEDKVIEAYKIAVRPENVSVFPVERVFE